MSVDAASLPQPGFYSYSSSLPTGLNYGSALSTGTAPAGSSSTAGSSTAATSYQQAYASLEQQDTAELLSVSFGSAQSAQSNIASVLAQASALQQQQQAAAQQAAAQAATTPITAPSIPTMTSVLQTSDANANSDLSNGTLGASVDTLA